MVVFWGFGFRTVCASWVEKSWKKLEKVVFIVKSCVVLGLIGALLLRFLCFFAIFEKGGARMVLCRVFSGSFA